MLLVQDFLENSAARTPDKVALICDGRCLTYAQVDAASNRLANALRAHGVGRGDRVVLHLPNSVELAVGIFAVLKAGGCFVVVNYTTKAEKLAHIMSHCQASALIASARKAEMANGLHEQTPSLRAIVLAGAVDNAGPWLSYEAIQAECSPEPPRRVNIDLDLACLLYTSGTTGEPKGVMCDHSNVIFASDSVIEYLLNVADDVLLDVLPLSHGYGLYQWLMVCRFGGTLVLEKGFHYPAAILQQMAAQRVTGFAGVPNIFAQLLQMDLTAYDLSNLRYVTNAAAALPPSHLLRLHEILPHLKIYSMHGVTETKRTVYLPPEDVELKPDSVGIAIPGTEAWIIDEEGNRLGPGEVGELVIRGRHVMRGYWADPAATAERFRPGPLPGERVCHTGDLFRTDEDGYFYFVSRKDDIIKVRGEKVAPKEIETVLYRLPGVHEAAVVGVPDPIVGQAIKAFVVTDGTPLSETQVLAHCRANLEDFMVPRFVEFCGELPKTESGKIKKVDLK